MTIDTATITPDVVEVCVHTLEGDYTPADPRSMNITQQRFHACPKPYRALVGAVRSGKTLAAVAECLYEHCRYPDVPGTILVIRRTGPELHDSTIPDFRRYFPVEFFRYRDGWGGESWRQVERRLLLTRGKEILFRSLDDVTKMGGAEFIACFVDQAEEIERTDWEFLLGRLSVKGTRGRAWLTANSAAAGWVYDWFDGHREDGELFAPAIYENRTHLPEGYIERLERTWQGRMRDAYLLGHRVSLSGRVWPEFQEGHVRSGLVAIEREPIVRTWDFGFRHSAVLWSQIDRMADRWNVLAEIEGIDTGIERFAREMLEFQRVLFPPGPYGEAYQDYGCPKGGQVSDQSEVTTIDILRAEFGINVRPVHMGIMPRVELVRHRLTKEGGFAVHPRCRRVIDGFRYGFVWDERTGRPKEDGNWEHIMEAILHFAGGRIHAGEKWEEVPEKVPTREAILRDRKKWFARLAGKEPRRRMPKLVRYPYTAIGRR